MLRCFLWFWMVWNTQIKMLLYSWLDELHPTCLLKWLYCVVLGHLAPHFQCNEYSFAFKKPHLPKQNLLLYLLEIMMQFSKILKSNSISLLNYVFLCKCFTEWGQWVLQELNSSAMSCIQYQTLKNHSWGNSSSFSLLKPYNPQEACI